MATIVTGDAGMTATMKTLYRKTFLDRVKEQKVYENGAQFSTHPMNEGKTVNFTRFSVPAVQTTALAEGVNPPEGTFTASTVSATIVEYGNTWKLSKFLSLTSIDTGNEQKIQIAGQHMGESRDARIRNELVTGGTLARPVGATSDVTTTSAMKLDGTTCRLIEAKLTKAKAMAYSGKYAFMAKLGVEATYDLSADQLFIDFQKNNSDGGQDMLRTNKIGAIYNTVLYKSTQPTVYTGAGASAIDLYSSVFHGDNSFGVLDLEGDKLKVYIRDHTQIDSANPAGRFGFIAWAGAEAIKVLNSAWVINYKHAASTV